MFDSVTGDLRLAKFNEILVHERCHKVTTIIRRCLGFDCRYIFKVLVLFCPSAALRGSAGCLFRSSILHELLAHKRYSKSSMFNWETINLILHRHIAAFN